MKDIPVWFVSLPGGNIRLFGHIKGRPFEATAANEEQIGMYVLYLIKKNQE